MAQAWPIITLNPTHPHSDWLRNGHITQVHPMSFNLRLSTEVLGTFFPLKLKVGRSEPGDAGGLQATQRKEGLRGGELGIPGEVQSAI